MDSIPPDEFAGIFDRFTHYVRLGRVGSPSDIKRRTRAKLDFYRDVYRQAKRDTTRAKYRHNYKQLKQLHDHNIHRRIWDEAVANPGGYVDLVLDYGRKRADEIQLRRARRMSGRMKRLRRRRS